jgi:hypothetical protein
MLDNVPIIQHDPVDGHVTMARTRRAIAGELEPNEVVMAVLKDGQATVRRLREQPGNRYTPVGAIVMGVALDALHFLNCKTELDPRPRT